MSRLCLHVLAATAAAALAASLPLVGPREGCREGCRVRAVAAAEALVVKNSLFTKFKILSKARKWMSWKSKTADIFGGHSDCPLNDRDDQWFDGEHNIPPSDPPRVIVHDPSAIPEAYRHVFGTNPPPGAERPIPPPPLPPNSYHKKPKYWQTRGTSYAQPNNRIAGVVCAVVIAGCFLLDRLNDAPYRWDKRLGLFSTPEEVEARDKNNKLFWEIVCQGVPNEAIEVSPDRTRYRNPRYKDSTIRWDVREIDERVVGIRDMRNPFEI
ncbi:unnamed protein product [Medioppia subpectinata]|uniref:Uncharacterized protein n=1 Tax=Medioppia subpectinata TaxID=1979941 RepID=A0A7R9KWP2_9ACAR|nr:unnamed protein product [Medioppia subpectinata]CAG2110111.1 unnamed protein product [Medioppia subpectinata]